MNLRSIVLLSLFAVCAWGALRPGEAAAQQYVECRSERYQYKECPVPWGQSRLVRQFSDTRCVEGQNWGQGRSFVWVHQGCAASFEAARGGGGGWQPGVGQIECRSERHRYNECRTNWRGARLIQQTSNATCTEGESWGFRNGVLWVDRGCTGIFAERRGGGGGWDPGGGQVECNSERNRYRECSVGNWPGAQLVRQTSNANCVEGQTWGYGRGVLWVDRGCAGVFAPARGGWRPEGRRATCNSQQNRYKECPVGGWRNAALARQTSRASCIEGRTWGYRRGMIWVDRGCAGEFVETR